VFARAISGRFANVVSNPSGRSSFEVRLRHVNLDRGGRPVLRDIDWQIRAGERWLVYGANGAGKTQLLKIVAGLVWPTPTGREERHYRVHGEWQSEPAEVLDEIAYIGGERQDRYDRYDWNFSAQRVVGTGIYRTDIPLSRLTARGRATIRRVLAQFGVEHLARRKFLTLSYGERRLVLIARALASRPKLLLLDEVANGLDAKRHAKLMQWLKSSAAKRLPWVIATHRPDDVPANVTHALQLDGGRIVRAGRTSSAVVRRELARQLDSVHGRFSRKSAAPARSGRVSHAPRRPNLVRLSNASVYLDGSRVLSALTFNVQPLQCWVVTGPNGSGKTTLLRTIYGDYGVAIDGHIERRGIAPGVSLEDFKRWVGLIAPHLQSDQPRLLRVIDAVASGLYSSVGLNDAPTHSDLSKSLATLRAYRLATLASRSLAELSYGQLRRVLFARAWVSRPKLLLLDEPFAGIDPRTRAHLLRQVEQFVAGGGACILATHHSDEWPRNVTHELRLEEGVPVRCGPVYHE
jgi:molybdate transport system ATP-binding protein